MESGPAHDALFSERRQSPGGGRVPYAALALVPDPREDEPETPAGHERYAERGQVVCGVQSRAGHGAPARPACPGHRRGLAEPRHAPALWRAANAWLGGIPAG